MKTARILVLPGIGDLHWVALKLQSFKEVNGIDRLDVWIWDFNNKPRSLEYLQRLPFLNAMGYWSEPRTPATEPAFHDVYFDGTRDIVPDFCGFDYLIAVNGSLRKGRSLITEILPEYAIDWQYPVTINDAGMRFQDPYVLLYFSDDGMFKHWLRRWDASEIQRFINEVQEALPRHKLVLTGSKWDAAFCDQFSGCKNLVGNTTLNQLLNLIVGADGFAGWPGGNTIVSTHLGTPTFMLWSDYFCEQMRFNWADPYKVGTIYRSADVGSIAPRKAAAKFVAQVKAGRGCREAVSA